MQVRSIKRKPFYVGVAVMGILVLAVWLWREVDPDERGIREIGKETVVVSRKDDPYYSLAQKIAQEENLDMVEEFADALQFNPKFVILVASPDHLTADKLYRIGQSLKDQDDYPALGIISGSTLDSAEQLWTRRGLVKEGNNFVGGDAEVPQLIYEPTIFDISDGAHAEIPLNKNSLIETLERADYFYWARHSGARTWYWNEGAENWGQDDQLFSQDIPQLKPVVIYSPTCQVFRPWEEDSIVLGFVDRGAAAYLGFLNSPHTTAFLKYGLFVPGITSWQEFPLGLVAQVGNKATTRAVFSSPQFFMLGDPRIYLSKERPYRVISDQVNENGTRVIKGESSTSNVLAVKVNDGADYDFVAVTGLASASEHDLFYNSKLQSLNLGADKYVSFLHAGGQFEIKLARKAPLGWSLIDTLTDVLDYSWVVLWLDNYSDSNPYIYALSLPVLIIILLLKLVKQKRPIKNYRMIFTISILLSLIRVGYYVIRLDDYTVSANLVSPTPCQVAIGGLGIFATTTGGLILMRDSKKKAVKALGFLLAVSRQLWLAGFRFAFITLLNNVPAVTKMTRPGVWNYCAFWLPFLALLIEVVVILAVYRGLPRVEEVPVYSARLRP